MNVKPRKPPPEYEAEDVETGLRPAKPVLDEELTLNARFYYPKPAGSIKHLFKVKAGLRNPVTLVATDDGQRALIARALKLFAELRP